MGPGRPGAVRPHLGRQQAVMQHLVTVHWKLGLSIMAKACPCLCPHLLVAFHRCIQGLSCEGPHWAVVPLWLGSQALLRSGNQGQGDQGISHPTYGRPAGSTLCLLHVATGGRSLGERQRVLWRTHHARGRSGEISTTARNRPPRNILRWHECMSNGEWWSRRL